MRAKQLGFGRHEEPSNGSGGLKGVNVKKRADYDGIHYSTLHRMLSGAVKDPTYNQIKLLLNALQLPCLEQLIDPQYFKITTELFRLSEDGKDSILKFICGLKEVKN